MRLWPCALCLSFVVAACGSHSDARTDDDDGDGDGEPAADEDDPPTGGAGGSGGGGGDGEVGRQDAAERPAVSDAGVDASVADARASNADGNSDAADAVGGAGVPSAGCGRAGRPSGGEIAVTDQYVLTFPASYDGAKPVPVVFGFHGANRTHVDFRNGDAGTKGTAFEQRYVMAYVRSIGTNWTSDLAANFKRFDDVYDVLAKNHCIDTSRVFAIGHSSGAQFISNLVCRPEARLRAVAPVASSPYGGNCRAIPALLIHGKTDSARGGGNGVMHVTQFVTRNGCESPAAAMAWPTCPSRQGGVTVNPGCVEYPGCGANRTVWCSHDDPFYSGTNHGWPCFANPLILDFFGRY